MVNLVTVLEIVLGIVVGVLVLSFLKYILDRLQQRKNTKPLLVLKSSPNKNNSITSSTARSSTVLPSQLPRNHLHSSTI